jgi:hypothetical protein
MFGTSYEGRLAQRRWPPLNEQAPIVFSIVLVALAAFLPTSTGGMARADIVVVESHVGERSDEVASYLAALRVELKRRGLIVDPAVIAKRLGQGVARPGIVDPKLTVDDLAKKFEAGMTVWFQGLDDEAVTKLKLAADLALRNPSLLSRVARLRGLLFDGLLSIAVGQQRLGQTADSEATMGEIIRSFPDRMIDKQEFGSEANDLYRVVRNNLTPRRGALSIQCSEPAVILFVNEVFRPSSGGSVNLSDLVPGMYRVLVRSLDISDSVRLYNVPVFASQFTRLSIDWNLDSVLVVEKWVGFRFATGPDQQDERQFAVQLARAMYAQSIVTIGVPRSRSGYQFVARFYDSATGRQERACRFPAALHSRRSLALLADCIDGKMNKAAVDDDATAASVDSSSRLLPGQLSNSSVQDAQSSSLSSIPAPSNVGASLSIVPLAAPLPIESTLPPEPDRNPVIGFAKWWVGVPGVSMLALGGLFLYFEKKGVCEGPLTDCNGGGYILLGTGALLTATSTYLFIIDVAPPSDVAIVRPRRRGWLAGVTWRW